MAMERPVRLTRGIERYAFNADGTPAVDPEFVVWAHLHLPRLFYREFMVGATDPKMAVLPRGRAVLTFCEPLSLCA